MKIETRYKCKECEQTLESKKKAEIHFIENHFFEIFERCYDEHDL